MHRRTFLAIAASLSAFALPASAQDVEVIGTGSFRDGDPVHRGSGRLSITRGPDAGRTVEMIDMEIVPGPNLFVYLVKEPDPLFPEDVTAGFTSLGKLKSLTGTQSYAVPDNIDPRDWGSVVVWCDTFKTAFAIATIEFS
ncbi:MAG: DM13 domain-containing protein [Alphaproteobacteria bacterium]|nr:DM13 domain-containing protein [Alphaproteobacteria bacterium]